MHRCAKSVVDGWLRWVLQTADGPALSGCGTACHALALASTMAMHRCGMKLVVGCLKRVLQAADDPAMPAVELPATH
jgi:hypothetical protein